MHCTWCTTAAQRGQRGGRHWFSMSGARGQVLTKAGWSWKISHLAQNNTDGMDYHEHQFQHMKWVLGYIFAQILEMQIRKWSEEADFISHKTQPNSRTPPPSPGAAVKQIKKGTQRKPGGLKKTLIASWGRGNAIWQRLYILTVNRFLSFHKEIGEDSISLEKHSSPLPQFQLFTISFHSYFYFHHLLENSSSFLCKELSSGINCFPTEQIWKVLDFPLLLWYLAQLSSSSQHKAIIWPQ